MPVYGPPLQGYYYDEATDSLRPLVGGGPPGATGPQGPEGPEGPPGPSGATPTGMIAPYAGIAAPVGWLLCNGASYLRADYALLYSIIGTIYGAADGTHFSVPDSRGRALTGFDGVQAEFDTLGKIGGEKSHLLTVAELATHAHGDDHFHGFNVNSGGFSSSHYHTPNGGGGVFYDSMSATFNWALAVGASIRNSAASTNWASHDHVHNVPGNTNYKSQQSFGATTANEGGNGGHNNLAPFLVINHIIKA